MSKGVRITTLKREAIQTRDFEAHVSGKDERSISAVVEVSERAVQIWTSEQSSAASNATSTADKTDKFADNRTTEKICVLGTKP